MPNNKLPFLTDTVKRFTKANVAIFIVIIIIFNLLLIYITNYFFYDSLDKRIKHEIENVVASLKVEQDTITITDFSEFNEPDLKEITETPYFLQVYRSDGTVIITSDNVEMFDPIPVFPDENYKDFTFQSITFPGHNLRSGFYTLKTPEGISVATLQLSTPEEEFNLIFEQIILFNLISLPIIILIVVIASIILAKKSFSPINKIIDTANSISVKELNRRIDIKANPTDELGKLRDTLNNLFNRLELYVDQVSQFTDQASHQLMNPLTAVKSELDYLLKKERSISEYREALGQLQKQTDFMISIVKTLLIIAKQDKQNNTGKKIFNLSRLLKKEIKDFYNTEKIEFIIEDGIYAKGDSEKFNMVIQNLINNAIKYSVEKKSIIVKLIKNDSLTMVQIIDEGIGIPDSEREKVFERFYRSESAELLGIKGYGLGLSLVKTIVTDMNGNVILKENKPKGTIAEITLPSVTVI